MNQLIPERRQRTRIVTLKNFGIGLIGVAVLLLVANLLSEFRKPRHGEYGGLFGKELPKTETIAPRKVEIVTEAPVEDRNGSDALLIAPAAREAQYLDVKPIEAPKPVAARAPVAIAGNPNGVTVIAPPRRLLRGGFGR
jgi:hypothetical protein